MAEPTKTNNIDPLAQLMGNRPKAKTASKERGTVMAAKEKDEGVQKFMLHLPSDLHTAIKLSAVKSGKTIQTVINECLAEGFKDEVQALKKQKE